MKNKKLHDIMKHSNDVTKSIVDKYNMTNPKEIAKINQITDLIIAVKDNKDLLSIIQDTLTETFKYIK